MESVRRSTRKRKCVDYNDNHDKSDLDCDPLQGSPSRISIQKTPHNVENVTSHEYAQTRKKKKLSLGKKSGTSNKEKELGEKPSRAQEVNMVVIVESAPTNIAIKDDAKDEDLFDDGELSDPPKDLDEDLKSEVALNNLKLQDKQTKNISAKLNNDLDDDTFVFGDTDDGSDYEESCKSKLKKKSLLNTGRKGKSTPVKEDGDVKKGKLKKQMVSTTNISTPSIKSASPLQTKKMPGGLKQGKAIEESNSLTPKSTSGPLSKIPSSGLSRKLKVKSLHPYLKKQ